jgi:hypothetical protein
MNPVRVHEEVTVRAISHRLRVAASRHAEEALAEVPVIARWLRRFVVVLAITVPLFATGIVVVLWRLAS